MISFRSILENADLNSTIERLWISIPRFYISATSIADQTIDFDELLILSDAYEDLGNSALAHGLRWLGTNRKYPTNRPDSATYVWEFSARRASIINNASCLHHRARPYMLPSADEEFPNSFALLFKSFRKAMEVAATAVSNL